MTVDALTTLQAKLGHTFTEPRLLHQALTHKSMGGSSNERLEFLGDAILNYVVGELLFAQFPTLAEGDLSRVRAAVVCHESLVKIAHRIGLEPLIRANLEHVADKSRHSMVSDALEAVFAAVQLDGGHDAAKAVISKHIMQLLEKGEVHLGKDPKTALQERLQARGIPVPEYRTTSEGTRGDRLFAVECRIERLKITARGSGPSRKHAEKDAAAKALRMCPA